MKQLLTAHMEHVNKLNVTTYVWAVRIGRWHRIIERARGARARDEACVGAQMGRGHRARAMTRA